MDHYPGLSRWALNVIYKCPYWRGAEGNLIKKRGGDNMTMETEAGMMRPHDESRRWPPEVGNSKDRIRSQSPQTP